MKTLRQDFATILTLLSMLAPAGAALAQAGSRLDGASPPVNGVWVDSLDLSKAMGGRPPRPGLAAFGGRPARGDTPAVPDAPITLGGTVYQRGLGVAANSELWIDLGGKAKRFV